MEPLCERSRKGQSVKVNLERPLNEHRNYIDIQLDVVRCEPTYIISCLPFWIIVQCWFDTNSGPKGHSSGVDIEKGYLICQ